MVGNREISELWKGFTIQLICTKYLQTLSRQKNLTEVNSFQVLPEKHTKIIIYKDAERLTT